MTASASEPVLKIWKWLEDATAACADDMAAHPLAGARSAPQ